MELPDIAWTAHTTRLRDEMAGNWLSGKEYLALQAIAYRNAAGDLAPTVAKIAAEAGCSPSTVRRATARARLRGLLLVEPQSDPDTRQQLPNEYLPLTPAEPVTPKPKPERKGGSQSDRPRQERKKVSKKEASKPTRGSLRASMPTASLPEIARLMRDRHASAWQTSRNSSLKCPAKT